MSSNMYNYYPEKKGWVAYVIVAVVAFVLGWQATSYGLLDVFNSGIDDDILENNGSAEGNVDLGLFWLVWGELNQKYFHEDALNEQQMVYGAIKGLTDALEDPYTVFMTPDESREFDDNLKGKLEGIGAELTVEDEEIVIVSPLRDSPAERAGLLPGDTIYKINDDYTYDMTLFEAIIAIRGKKGTSVNLTIIREGLKEPFEVSIVRDSISIESVSEEMLEGDIAYVSVNQFNDKTAEEFNTAISGLILSEPKGLILDLRYNGGGYLDIAVELLSFLLPSNTEAVKIDQREKEEEIMKTNGHAKLLDVPLVVLVNEGSASASEIVAGAIQDQKRGVVMGTQSFGKGTVQEVESFSDGSSIRMTIAEWLTPNGRSINKTGITPDIVVELSEEDITNQYDSQKERAAEYLRGL